MGGGAACGRRWPRVLVASAMVDMTRRAASTPMSASNVPTSLPASASLSASSLPGTAVCDRTCSMRTARRPLSACVRRHVARTSRTRSMLLRRGSHILYCTVHMRKGPRDASEAERAGGPPRADEPATRVLGLERPHRAHPARAPWPGRRSTWRTAPWCHNPGAGEQYWPTTRQRAGRGRARAAIPTWVATSGAVAPPGRRSALPHAAPRTRAPPPRKNQYGGIERSVRRRDASARAVGECLHPPGP